MPGTHSPQGLCTCHSLCFVCSFPQVSPWLTLLPPSALYENVTSSMRPSLATPSEVPHLPVHTPLYDPALFLFSAYQYVTYYMFSYLSSFFVIPEPDPTKKQRSIKIRFLTAPFIAESPEFRRTWAQSRHFTGCASNHYCAINTCHTQINTENSKDNHCNYPNPHQSYIRWVQLLKWGIQHTLQNVFWAPTGINFAFIILHLSSLW